MTQRGDAGARPQDFTGRKKAQLAQEHSAAVQARENELAMMNAAEAEILDTQVIDTTEPVIAQAPAGPVELLELDGAEVVREATTVITVREDCNPTVGAGNHYDFKAGAKYRVPTSVADHLEEKGLVYH